MSATGADAAPATLARDVARARARRRRLPTREISVFVALVLLVGITQIANPRFLDAQGVRDLLLNSTIFVVLAVGQTLVVVTRNVDLSVGSILGLAAFTTGSLFHAAPGIPIPAVFAIAIALGALLGLVNGVIVRVAVVPALVITLGTLYIFRGANFAWAGGTQYFIGDAPADFATLAVQTVLGIPVITLVAFAIAVVVAVVLYGTRSGRDLYAIGSDPDAAALFGIPVTRRVVAAFVASGALAGLAGVLYAARFNSVGADTGTGLEFQVIAAVVVGGVAIFGGSGSAIGAAIGAVLLTTMTGALTALNISKFWTQAIVGALIIAAILIDRIIAIRTARRLLLTEDRLD